MASSPSNSSAGLLSCDPSKSRPYIAFWKAKGMKKKIFAMLVVVVVLIAAGAATFGYFRIHADEQRVAVSAPTDKPPNIMLDGLDDAYLLEIRLLARAGNVAAQTVLGVRHQYGLGVPVNVVLM